MGLPIVDCEFEGPGETFTLRWDLRPDLSLLPSWVVERVVEQKFHAVPTYVAGLRRLRHLAGTIEHDPFLDMFDTVIRERILDESYFGVVRAFFHLSQDAIAARPWDHPGGGPTELFADLYSQIGMVLFAECEHVGLGAVCRVARLPGDTYTPVKDWQELKKTRDEWAALPHTQEQIAWPTIRTLIEQRLIQQRLRPAADSTGGSKKKSRVRHH